MKREIRTAFWRAFVSNLEAFLEVFFIRNQFVDGTSKWILNADGILCVHFMWTDRNTVIWENQKRVAKDPVERV